MAPLREARAAALAVIVLAFAMGPALAQAEARDLQEILDAVPKSTELPAGTYEGPAILRRPLSVHGPQHAVARIVPPAGEALPPFLVEAHSPEPFTTLSDFTYADAPGGVRAAAGIVQLLGGRFVNVTRPLHVDAGALALVGMPAADLTVTGEGIALEGHGMRFRIGDLDPVAANATVTLLDPAGVALAEWRDPILGGVGVFRPTGVLDESGRHALPEGYRFLVRADGVEPVEIGVNDVRMPVHDVTPVPAVASAAPARFVAGAAVAMGIGLAAAAGLRAVVTHEWRRYRLALMLAPLYSRIPRRRLLEHPTRERVLAFVRANPGCHYRQLRRALGVSNGALAHHVEKLVRERFLVARREGRYLRFHAAEAPPAFAPAVDTGERVLAFVRDHPGARARDVARELDLTSSLVAYHLDRLENGGRIHRARSEGRVRVYALDAAPNSRDP